MDSTSRVLVAQASTPVKVLAIAALIAEIAASLAFPSWLMGVIVGVQAMAVREAFRQIKIPI
jgi:hypothetical protein